MGYDPTRVRHLVYSAYYGLGQNDLSQIEIVGASLGSVRRNFDPPGPPAQVYRRGTVIAAPPDDLALDGDLGEWADRPPLMINQAEHVQDGRSDWSGAADASVSAWVAYDDRYLYLAARVWDDVRIPNAGGPGSIWNGYALELYFSGAEQDARGRTAEYLASDFRLGVGYGQVRLCDIGRGRVLSAQMARRELADGYALELRIPWSELNGFVPSRNYEIGLDIALQGGMVLSESFPERIAASPLMVAMVKQGLLGRKSGAGFFVYPDQQHAAADDTLEQPNPAAQAIIDRVALQWGRPAEKHTTQTILMRLLLPMVLEASRIIAENKVQDPRDIDLAAIFGLGFPEVRGGLLWWADTYGPTRLLNMLRGLERLGARAQPTPLLREMARRDVRFYQLAGSTLLSPG